MKHSLLTYTLLAALCVAVPAGAQEKAAPAPAAAADKAKADKAAAEAAKRKAADEARAKERAEKERKWQEARKKREAEALAKKKAWEEFLEKRTEIRDFVNGLDLTSMTEKPIYIDRARMSEVIFHKQKNLLRRDTELRLYGDRIVLDEGTGQEISYPFAELSAVTVLGRNKLNIYHGKTAFQFKGSKRFNALKYVNFYYRHKNIVKGVANEQFLGL